MRNLHLNELVARKYHPKFQNSDVKKIIHQNTYTAILARENVYLLKYDVSIKINSYPVIDFDWLQAKNVIFIWSNGMFEWYNVIKKSSQCIDYSDPSYGSVKNCTLNQTNDKLAVIYNTGRVEIIEFDCINYTWLLVGGYNIEMNQHEIDIAGSAISWNKQSDSFAVVYFKDSDIVLNIFSENCELLGQGYCSSLDIQPNISWNPDGTIIAVLENKNNYNIQFFECNGLKKSSLRLDYIQGKVQNIKFEWNNIGDVFAVICTTDIESTVSLYSHCNFKWDLKQHLIFNNNIEVKSFSWVSALKQHIMFHVVTSLMEITYAFNWAIDKLQDHSVQVAAIDQQVLRLTNISDEMIPPPLASQYVIYSKPINFVKFSPKGNYTVLVSDDNVATINRPDHSLVYEVLLTEAVGYEGIPLSFNNFYLDNEANLFFIKNSFNCSSVYKISNPGYKTFNISDNVRLLFKIEHNATYMSVYKNEIIIRTDENVQKYNLETMMFTEIAPYIPPGEIHTLCTGNSYHIFSLCEQDFIMDEKLIFNDITSYIICDSYIVLTTASKLLCYQRNSTDLNELKNGKTYDNFTREISRDATIIAADRSRNNIILEIARGELEIIKPRALSIKLVSKLLENKEYQEAFTTVKSNRLDMNILIDLNSQMFIDNVNEFIGSFKNCTELNIFITSLSDDNMVLKLYKSCVPEYSHVRELVMKKAFILNMVIDTMKDISHGFYLESIIVANLMFRSPRGMTEAMKEVLWGIREAVKDKTFPIDDIFCKILPLSNEEDLLKAALSTQEFTLVQWIASRTQLDPLEYIPFFLELSHMTPDYKTYAINSFLKRYDLAYESLIKCDNIQIELEEILDTGDVFNVAVQKTPPDNQWYPLVMMDCAMKLFYKDKHTESGLLFKRIKKYKSAFEAFTKDGNFDEFMKLAEFVKHTDENEMLDEQYMLMADRLKDEDPKKAAILLDLMGQYEEGIILLIAKKEWTEAMRYILKYNRTDFIETDFYPAIIAYTKELSSVFIQKRIDYENKLSRLEQVRAEMVTKLMMKRMRLKIPEDAPVEFEESEDVRNADISSVMSQLSVTTQQTGMSSASTATKNKRKLARKVQEAREGSVFENIALMRQLYLMITEIYSYSKNVRNTYMNLLELEENVIDQAVSLQNIYSELIETIEKTIATIWPEAFINPPKPLDLHSSVLQLNVEHLEPKYRCPPPPLSSDWKVSILEPFVIL